MVLSQLTTLTLTENFSIKSSTIKPMKHLKKECKDNSKLFKEKGNNSIHKNRTISKNEKIWKQVLAIKYIVNITILRSNVFLHFSDAKGKTILILSSNEKSVKMKKKQQKGKVLTFLLNCFIAKTKLKRKYPVAVHLKNSQFYHSIVFKKLEAVFIIRSICTVDNVPFNGCRKPKLKRKRNVKHNKK